MARNIGTGLRETGGRIQELGLMMLKSGISEQKVREAQDALQSYEDFLRNKGIPETEIDGELQKAADEVVDSATRDKPLTGGEQSGVGLAALKDEPLGEAGVTSTEIAPGKTLAEPPSGTRKKTTIPLSERMGRYQETLADPETARRRQAALKAGASMEDVRATEERVLSGMVGQARAKMLEEQQAFSRETKGKELELQEMDIERKRMYNEARAQIMENKNKFDKWIKSQNLRLDQDILEWRKSIKKKYGSASSRNEAVKQVRVLKDIIEDSEQNLRLNSDYFDFEKEARGSGYFDKFRDLLSPQERKEYNESGKALKKRVDEYKKIMHDLIQEFGITQGMISVSSGSVGAEPPAPPGSKGLSAYQY